MRIFHCLVGRVFNCSDLFPNTLDRNCVRIPPKKRSLLSGVVCPRPSPLYYAPERF